MKSYTTPDLETDIGTLRSKVRRDYAKLIKKFNLPPECNFEHVLTAVRAGTLGIAQDDTYKQFRDRLLGYVANAVDDVTALQEVMEVVTGVWNHFPHDDLGGLSPVEKMREAYPSGTDMGQAIPQAIGTNDDAYQKEMSNIVLSFSEAVSGNLLYYLKEVGLGKAEHKKILGILSDPRKEPEEAIMMLFTALAKNERKKPGRGKKNEVVTSDDMQPVARALMWCENYTASRMSNGHYTSRMTQYVVEQVMDFNTKVVAEAEGAHSSTVALLEPSGVLRALSSVHDAISEFSDIYNMDIGIEEATRHLVDWIAMTDVHELLKKEDLNITTYYMFSAARLIAALGDPRRPYKRLDTQMKKAIDEEDSEAYDADRVSEIAKRALESAGDPVMLMPYPGREPRDCIEKLAVLAPSLRLRSPLDSGDLDTPSPLPFL